MPLVPILRHQAGALRSMQDRCSRGRGDESGADISKGGFHEQERIRELAGQFNRETEVGGIPDDPIGAALGELSELYLTRPAMRRLTRSQRRGH